jgi:hypothetical protein
MSVTFPTAWPAALTDKEWQKKKSFKDKTKKANKTGLGAELIKAQKAWDLIKFDNFIASKHVMTTTVLVDQFKSAAETHRTTVVKAASSAIMAAAEKARVTKGNATLSTTAQTAAATIERGLLKQSGFLRDISLSDFDDARQNILQLTAQTNLAAVKRNLKKADEFIKAVTAEPTRLKFNTGIQDACRYLTVPLGTIGTTIPHKPDPAPLMQPLKRWADGFDEVPKGKDAEEEKTKVEEALDKYKDAIHHITQWAA